MDQDLSEACASLFPKCDIGGPPHCLAHRSNREEKDFTYVGLHIVQNDHNVEIDQKAYINDLKYKILDNVENKNRVLTETELKDFRSMVGSINWCVIGTRPDLSFELNTLSVKLRNATVGDFLNAQKSIRKLQNNQVHITIPDLKMFDPGLEIVVFTDAAFRNQDKKIKSTMAYIIYCKRNDLYCPIDWKTNKIKRVVLSTLAAEGLALARGIQNAIFYKKYIENLVGNKIKITAYADNKGMVESLYSTNQLGDKILSIDLELVKQCIKDQEVDNVLWVKGPEMVANALTKMRAKTDSLLHTLLENKMY